MDWFRRLVVAEKGSILMMSAFALTAIMGMTGLAVEIGNCYTTKVRNQRVADMAALGAALAYQSTASTAMATQVAKDIVTSSGLAATAATVTMPVTVGSVSGVQVQITTAVPIRLASMLGGGPSYSVSTSAIASLGGNTTLGCVMALDKNATKGIYLNGAASMDVSGCAALSNSAVLLEGSASLKTASVTSGSTITKPQWSGTLTGTLNPNTANAATDPLAGNGALTAAFANLGVTTAPTTPVMPGAPTIDSSATNWTFPDGNAYAGLVATDPVKANCTYSSNQYSCKAGTYTINNISIAGNMKVTFAGPSTITVYGTLSDGGSGLRFDGGAGSVFKFRNGFASGSGGVIFGAGDIYIAGNTTLNATSAFGDGTITINGSLTTGGSSTVTIGAGAHAFASITVGGSGRLAVGAGNLIVTGGITTGGSTTTSFGDGAYVVGKDGSGYSINHTGNTLTFGAGGFSGTGGIYVNGSSTLTFGVGNLTLGTSASNGAIYLNGSATMTMGAGNLNAGGAISTGGSSTINFGVGASHNINGTLTINGGGTMGAGRYTINGNFYKSASLGVTANNVTIIAAGNFYTGGSASLTLTAPTNDSGGGLAGIAFASKSTTASTIEGSSSNVIGGIMYLPYSDLTIAGAGSAAGSTCFALIVKTLAVTGGSSASSGCTMPTIASGASVALIQ